MIAIYGVAAIVTIAWTFFLAGIARKGKLLFGGAILVSCVIVRVIDTLAPQYIGEGATTTTLVIVALSSTFGVWLNLKCYPPQDERWFT